MLQFLMYTCMAILMLDHGHEALAYAIVGVLFLNLILAILIDWYERLENIKLHPETRKKVDRLLERIRNELDKEN